MQNSANCEVCLWYVESQSMGDLKQSNRDEIVLILQQHLEYDISEFKQCVCNVTEIRCLQIDVG